MKSHFTTLTAVSMRVAVISAAIAASLFGTGTAFGAYVPAGTTIYSPTLDSSWSNAYGGSALDTNYSWNNGSSMGVCTYITFGCNQTLNDVITEDGSTSGSVSYRGQTYWSGGGTPTGGTVTLGAYFNCGTFVHATWNTSDVDISWWDVADAAILPGGSWQSFSSEGYFAVSDGVRTSPLTLWVDVPFDDYITYDEISGPFADDVYPNNEVYGYFEWQWTVPTADWPVPQGLYRVAWTIWSDVSSNLSYSLADTEAPCWIDVSVSSWDYSEAHDMVCGFTPND